MKKREDTDAVRALEKQRSMNRGNVEEDAEFSEGGNYLDDLWDRVRNCLNDKDEKGNPAEDVKN